MSNEELQYYSRQIILGEIGLDGQNKLKDASVLVIGAGGLGCPILQQLAAIGIGNIGIVDFDKISLSNLHRQSIYKYADIGKWKCEMASLFLKELNPFINVHTFRTIFKEDNALELIRNYNIIVDCTDNPLSKYLINDACVVGNKPLVYGSVFKHEGNVSVFNTNEDAPTLRCLFPETSDEVPNCERSGVTGITTAITGSYMANEVVKIVLGNSHILESRLLIFNSLTSETKIINFNADPYARLVSNEKFNGKSSLSIISCIRLKELMDTKADLQLIDVRTLKEHHFSNIGGHLISLDTLEEEINDLDRNRKTIIYCHHGIRSKNAVDFLKDAGFKDVQSLEGGIHAWSMEINNKIPIY